MRTYGSALAATERLFPIFFCNEQSEIGSWYGWPSIQFYRLFDQVTNIITDSEYLAQWFNDIYQLDAGSREKIRVFRAPVDPTLPVVSPDASSRPSRRPTVFWAGRWDRQKKIDLVFQVARLMPEVEFRMWGESVLQRRTLTQLPDNVKVEGTYAAFTDLNLERGRCVALHVCLGRRADDPARGGNDRRSHCRQPRRRYRRGSRVRRTHGLWPRSTTPRSTSRQSARCSRTQPPRDGAPLRYGSACCVSAPRPRSPSK